MSTCSSFAKWFLQAWAVRVKNWRPSLAVGIYAVLTRETSLGCGHVENARTVPLRSFSRWMSSQVLTFICIVSTFGLHPPGIPVPAFWQAFQNAVEFHYNERANWCSFIISIGRPSIIILAMSRQGGIWKVNSTSNLCRMAKEVVLVAGKGMQYCTSAREKPCYTCIR